MILKLDQIPKRSLEIEMPEGKIVILTIKKIQIKDVPAVDKENRIAENDFKKGKINAWEYYIKMISSITENFNPVDFENLEVEHIIKISEKLRDLQANKESEEKKSLG